MEESKTHWKKNFNYNYLGSYSLKEDQEVTLTITGVKKELVTSHNGEKESCTVATFEEAVNGEKKPMILNKTNCKIIENLYGTPYIELWAGKMITIYVDNNIKAFGSIVEALRIKQLAPKKTKPELTPKHKLWEKASIQVQTGEADFDSISKNWIITEDNFQLLCG
jgi:hypothetical protein